MFTSVVRVATKANHQIRSNWLKRSTSSRVGWTVGGGFEYAVTQNFTVKTEYLYVNLGMPTAFDQNLLGVVGVNVGEKTTANIVRAGLNYKFDLFASPPAVVAKY
jgi:outer membrane immunogenic protein